MKIKAWDSLFFLANELKYINLKSNESILQVSA